MVKSAPGTPRAEPKARKTNNPAHRDRKSVKKPRRAGLYTQIGWDLNRIKSTHTLAKYRTGYRTAWSVPQAKRYMKSIGLKAPGTYNKHNQQGGDMFALPNEFKMTDKQAGQILKHCAASGKLTISNLKDVKKMLSYAYQLKKKEEGNWPLVKWIWKNTDKDIQKAATQKIIAEVVAEPSTLVTAFTTEYDPKCGMDFMEWNVGQLLTHDYAVCGCRQVEDYKRIRDSKSHVFVPQHGWMATEFKGGRAKLEKTKGMRSWKLYRVCLCPGAKHQRIPKDWATKLDKYGNPKKPLPWCTTCPLNAFQMVRNMLPEGDLRTYPKWYRGKFHKTWNVGEDSTKELFQRWLNVQKANPDGVLYDSNGGRKSLGKWCAEFGVPYEESFEIHGDHWKTWRKYYQQNLQRASDFERRTQHTDAEVCTRALWRFARGIGRGRTTRHDPEVLTERQKAAAMLHMMRQMGMHAELANILQG